MGLFGAERRPADQAFEHDGTNGPPIAAEVVSLAAEDFWRDVVGCTDSGVGKLTTGFPPCVDLCSVADCQLDLVHVHRVAVVAIRLVRAASEQLLVVAGVMLLVETCGQTEICQLDVTTTVQKNVIGLDITRQCQSAYLICLEGTPTDG